MTNTIPHVHGMQIFVNTILAVLALFVWTTLLHAETAEPLPTATAAYVNRANSNHGSIGRTNLESRDANLSSISGPSSH